MPLPDPEPGLVIRYDYLWSGEAQAGRNQSKERPACLLIASDPSPKPAFVVLLPITHTRPRGNTVGIEISAAARKHLKLDDAPCWVIVSEYNVDEWPNGGMGQIPGRPGVFSYGFIPPGLFAQIKAKFIELAGRRSQRSVKR